MTMNSQPDRDLETAPQLEDRLLSRPKNKFGLSQRDVYSLIGWIGLVAVVALCGSLATRSSPENWNPGLDKPWFHRPAWIFGPVWTALYVMMAISAWMIWRRRDDASHRRAVNFFAVVFVIQLALNVLWSVLFFGLRSPMWAFMEICMLWIAVATTVFLSFRQNKLAGWMLVPYLGWASFALVLNLIVWRSNS